MSGFKYNILYVISFLFTCCTYVFVPKAGFAQLSTNKKITINLDQDSEEEFSVISYQARGLLVMGSKTNNFGIENELRFIRLNQEMEEVWQNKYNAESLYHLVKYVETEHYFYCLFREQESRKIAILRVDVETGDYLNIETTLLTPLDIDFFRVIKSKALIGGRYNERPVIEMISLVSKAGKVLPAVHSNNLKLDNIEINQDEERIYVMLKNSKNCRLSIKTYDYDGRLLSNEILGEKNKLPLSGELIRLPGGTYVLAGNYADNCSEYSTGFYTHWLATDLSTKYYDFTMLKNFLNYMPDKRQSRVLSRIEKRSQKGKDFKLRQRLLVHEPIETENGLTILAEVFYPEHKNYNTSGLPMGRNYRWGANNFYTFNNFRYTHALILHFDKGGKLLWDNSVNLKNLESHTLDPKSQLFALSEKKLLLAYPDNGLIKTMIVDADSRPVEDQPLRLEYKEDWMVEGYQTELAAWYGKFFIAYGVQNIKIGNGRSMKVFFINRLSYK